jgi:ABC-type amino acid transport substrate-binding protein
MDEICRRNGFTCEYRAYAVRPGLEAVARGEADIALGGLGISQERESYGTFTCPYRQGNVSNVPIFALSGTSLTRRPHASPFWGTPCRIKSLSPKATRPCPSTI